MIKLKEPFTKRTRCKSCKFKGHLLTPEGNKVECSYCRGTKYRNIQVPHPSHKMTTWKTEIRSPTGGEPRFYGVRHCRKCGVEELKHPAGHFLSQLSCQCSGKVASE